MPTESSIAPAEHPLAPSSSPASTAWSQALDACARAVQAIKLYGSEHALAARSLREASELLLLCDFTRVPLFMGVGPTGFSMLGMELSLSDGAGVIAASMHDADIAAIEWLSRPNADDAQTLIRWLARLSDRSAEDPPTSPSCIRVIKVGSHALRFAADRDDRGATWDAVLQSLVTGDAPGQGVVASAIDRVRGQMASASAEELARAEVILRDISRRIGAPPEAGAHADGAPSGASIGDVLMNLNPELRASLINLGAMQGSAWIAESASTLPIADLTSAFLSVDTGGSRPPSATVMLLSKLVGMTGLQTELRRKLESVSSRWSAFEISGQAHADAVAELLNNRGVADFCPDDYRSNLTAASTRPQGQIMMPTEIGQLAPSVIVHRCAQIAEWLMNDPPCPGADNAGPVLWVGDRAGELSEESRRSAVHAALTCVSTWPDSDDPRLTLALSRLRETLADRANLEALMHSGVDLDQAGQELSRILRLAPQALVEFFIERVSAGRMSASHAHVRRVAGEATLETFRRVFAGASSREELAPGLLAMCTHMPEDTLVLAAEPLIAPTVPDAIRQGVFGVLDQRVAAWPRQLMSAALADRARAVTDMALRRLVSRHDSADVATLALALRGGAAEIAPPTYVASVLIRALSLHGPPGVVALIDVLHTFSRGVNRDRIRICRRIAFELEPRRGVPEVDKALRAWRRSIGHTVGLFIVEDNGRAAA